MLNAYIRDTICWSKTYRIQINADCLKMLTYDFMMELQWRVELVLNK
jgi:hypothetical protein